MSSFYLFTLLITGVIFANIVKTYLPKVPDAFILILTGVALSFTPVLHNYTLEPELFLLLIIAPIMFVEGQAQDARRIRARFGMIIKLSVVLAVLTAVLVSGLTLIETHWTLPLAIALAAIVVPTDAVAVNSITQGRAVPGGVNEALSLESLFNDATGLVMLDLALSVLEAGNFSLINGLGHFLFVAVGGVVVGIVGSFLLITLRMKLNLRAISKLVTTIPINLLTPFAIYLLAESLGVSGILAVVASGLVHNIESRRLRLVSTDAQLTVATLWQSINAILNNIVFLLLGLSLPSVFNHLMALTMRERWALVVLSVGIYVLMLVWRYVWARFEKNPQTNQLMGKREGRLRHLNAKVFGVSGVHGAVTLAMAFSLPRTLNGAPFPFRDEIIICASLVIIISLIVAAVVLPLILPAKKTAYSENELRKVRNKMIDYAILKLQDNVSDYAVREAVSTQLQSQKRTPLDDNLASSDQDFQNELDQTITFAEDYLHGDYVSDHYPAEVIKFYDQMLQRTFQHRQKNQFWLRSRHFVRRAIHETIFHIETRTFTKHQRQVYFQRQLQRGDDNPRIQQAKKWQDNWEFIRALNTDLAQATDRHLNDILRERLANTHRDNVDLDRVRHTMNEFFQRVQRHYQSPEIEVDSSAFIQAFQYEYDFVQNGLAAGRIKPALADRLFNEINQAQSLELMENGTEPQAAIE
ncbi:sodium:proton antiporter [Lactobacillaceae bacterium L1_55_11]|nr:sodium:proton antiporter [Lactobacillaceae bacterium L1_55_11]